MDHRSETGLWFISQAAFSRDYQSIFLPKYQELSGQSEPIGVFHAHAFDAKNMSRNLSGLTDNQTCTPQASVPIPISLFAKTTLANIRQNEFGLEAL
jgi:hypothetical protein